MISDDPQAVRRIVNRLRRARGQLDGVISAIENEAPCRDVVTQLSAVTSALDRAGFAIISTAMRECLSEDATPSDEESSGAEVAEASNDASSAQESPTRTGDAKLTTAELEKLFLMLA
ncbi:metal-sensitive transcriptional regulator [Pseudoclavibacter sp. CFCC 14310]|uniref:metal-sensitive transcriptional regulator n=1 Tax=Pseudoclavibacter sp. CFCC 14310 TaxID=2615180 RepID=UPI001300F6D0|nr:metal-sensitive transcriptional regulator [Pseudoclavibacter sp. CFCC 14310]KAB1645651.1 metal-sensitive transcriptional regulator [Pseudoclavibacter sp. CFCC 14310]